MSGSKNSKRDTKMRTGQREESIAKRIPKQCEGRGRKG